MAETGVGYIRGEAQALLSTWWMIRDAIEGEAAIKGEFGVNASYFAVANRMRVRADKYLPRPNPTDLSQENQERYRAYVMRAVWYNFTARTLDGLVGQVFLRPPVETKPDALNILDTNCDGEGLTLTQVAKRTTQSVTAYGRAGLYTDYPPTVAGSTVAELAQGNIQPTIKHFYPWQITNWATTLRGAKYVLSMVVLQEVNLIQEGDFALVEEVTYRVLRLTDGVYTVEIWGRASTAGGNKSSKFTLTKPPTAPTDHDGNTFDEIPFTFVGSEANDIWPDRPPMYDLASLNIAHYRNSADYEESCFIVGQPTPVVTGVTEEWVTNVLKGKIELGSRASVCLPVGGVATLLQAAPNQMTLEAMKLKEDQALSLGAKLVQVQKTVRTATEVMVDTTSETSTLHNVAKNVSTGMEQSLIWAAQFAVGKPKALAIVVPGKPSKAISYQLNTEFELTRMNANDRLAVVKLWQCGAIAFTEMRDVLRVDGTAQLDDDTALGLISKEQAAAALLGGAPIADPLQATAPLAPANVPAVGGPAPVPAPKPKAKAKPKPVAA